MRNLFLMIIALTCLTVESCTYRSPEFSSFTGFAQGTTYSMVFANRGRQTAERVKKQVERILSDFDMSLSLYKDSSILSKVNRNEDVQVDPYFEKAFRISEEINSLTDGAFDITVGPLVKAWGFGPDAHRDMTEAKRDSLLKLVGMDKVELRNGRVIKSDPRISLDLNAIAQGYSVDVICDYFNSCGFRSYLVEIGGEVRVKGDKGGVLWRIGIDKPVDNNNIPGRELEAVISLRDRALATSGNYRKFYVENGIKYSHTIDPRTGEPARNTLLSATVVASDCATADGIATACMVIGKDRAIEFIGSHPEFDAFFVYSDENGGFGTWTSENLKKFVSE